jgi:hypothetical protein
VLGCALRAVRSLPDACLPPCMSRAQRREIEGALVSALEAAEGRADGGGYWPAPGSTTWAKLPAGVDAATADALREAGVLPAVDALQDPKALSWG